MTDKIVVLITTRNLQESKKVARRLVESELAACVNIVPSLRSIYRWQGKVQDEQECLLMVKSTRALFPQIEVEVRKVHSYQTPELICLPIVDGSQDYLAWVDASVKRAAVPAGEPSAP